MIDRVRERLRPILILVGILVALALPLMFLLENFVQEAIVVPLAYYAWIAGVVLDALPQGYLLTALLAIIIYIAARSLPRDREARRAPARATRQAPGRVRIWLERVSLVAEGVYSRERLDHQMGQFVLQIMSHSARLPIRETVSAMDREEINVPPEIADYVASGLRPAMTETNGFWYWIRSVLGLTRRRRVRIEDVRAQIEPPLTYAEHELRIRPPEAKDDDAVNN